MPTYKYQNASVTGDATVKINFRIPEGQVIVAVSIHCKYDGFDIVSMPYMDKEESMTGNINIESEDYDSMYELWDGGIFRMVLLEKSGSTNEVTVKVVTLNKKTLEFMKRQNSKFGYGGN